MVTDPLSIRQLETFVALIDRGSFTKAARFLNLSQSTVSGHIAELERRLGVRLVERDRGGAKPTSAGHALLRPAREALRAERNARQAIADLTGLLSGTLVLGASTIPASYLLPRLIAEFHTRYPAVSIRMITGDSDQILDRVSAGEVEAAFVGRLPKRNDLHSDEVDRDRLILVASPAHALASRGRVSLADIADQPLVMRERGSGTRAATEAALSVPAGRGGVHPGLNVVCEVGSTEAMKAAVVEGLGMAFLSDLAVRAELASKTLVEIPLEEFSVRREFHLVRRDGKLLSPAAQAFVTIALEGHERDDAA